MDTSSSIGMLGLKRTKELIRIYGAERIEFGTDYPMWRADDEIKNIMSLGLNDDEIEMILYKNACKILDIE